MVTETILSSPFLKEIALPFLLVFVLVFAILQKSEILGKEKKQVDAIVALVVGLLVVAVGSATNIIVGLMPILAVGLVVLLVFFLLWGFAFRSALDVPNSIKWTIGVAAAVAVIIGTLYLTGSWDYLKSMVGGGASSIVTNIVFIVLIVIAVVVVVGLGAKPENKP